MKKYEYDVCGYIYDPAVGDPDNGISPEPLLKTSRKLGLPRMRRGQNSFSPVD